MTSATPASPRFTIRELANHEYALLSKVPPFDTMGIPDPLSTRVVVAQDPGGVVIGYCFLHASLHVEPFGIAPEHQGDRALARQLWEAVKTMMQQSNEKVAYAVIPDESLVVAGIAQKLGFSRIPAGLYWVTTQPSLLKPANGEAHHAPEDWLTPVPKES